MTTLLTPRRITTLQELIDLVTPPEMAAAAEAAASASATTTTTNAATDNMELEGAEGDSWMTMAAAAVAAATAEEENNPLLFDTTTTAPNNDNTNDDPDDKQDATTAAAASTRTRALTELHLTTCELVAIMKDCERPKNNMALELHHLVVAVQANVSMVYLSLTHDAMDDDRTVVGKEQQPNVATATTTIACSSVLQQQLEHERQQNLQQKIRPLLTALSLFPRLHILEVTSTCLYFTAFCLDSFSSVTQFTLTTTTLATTRKSRNLQDSIAAFCQALSEHTALQDFALTLVQQEQDDDDDEHDTHDSCHVAAEQPSRQHHHHHHVHNKPTITTTTLTGCDCYDYFLEQVAAALTLTPTLLHVNVFYEPTASSSCATATSTWHDNHNDGETMTTASTTHDGVHNYYVTASSGWGQLLQESPTLQSLHLQGMDWNTLESMESLMTGLAAASTHTLQSLSLEKCRMLHPASENDSSSHKNSHNTNKITAAVQSLVSFGLGSKYRGTVGGNLILKQNHFPPIFYQTLASTLVPSSSTSSSADAATTAAAAVSGWSSLELTTGPEESLSAVLSPVVQVLQTSPTALKCVTLAQGTAPPCRTTSMMHHRLKRDQDNHDDDDNEEEFLVDFYRWLALALKYNTVLQSLTIRNLAMPPQLAVSIASGLGRNGALRELTWDDCSVTNEMFLLLLSACESNNNTLASFTVRYNSVVEQQDGCNLSARARIAAMTLLQHNTGLKRLVLHDTKKEFFENLSWDTTTDATTTTTAAADASRMSPRKSDQFIAVLAQNYGLEYLQGFDVWDDDRAETVAVILQQNSEGRRDAQFDGDKPPQAKDESSPRPQEQQQGQQQSQQKSPPLTPASVKNASVVSPVDTNKCGDSNDCMGSQGSSNSSTGSNGSTAATSLEVSTLSPMTAASCSSVISSSAAPSPVSSEDDGNDNAQVLVPPSTSSDRHHKHHHHHHHHHRDHTTKNKRTKSSSTSSGSKQAKSFHLTNVTVMDLVPDVSDDSFGLASFSSVTSKKSQDNKDSNKTTTKPKRNTGNFVQRLFPNRRASHSAVAQAS